MIKSRINNFYVKKVGDRVVQGDIFIDLKYFYSTDIEKGKYDCQINWGIVITQDCDLDLDFKYGDSKPRLRIPNIIFCPAYPKDLLFQGKHIEGENRPMEKDVIKRIEENTDNRYFLIKANNEQIMTDLVVDFKHIYSVPKEILYECIKNGYMITVNELFRESLVQRFSNYISRIALPELDSIILSN